MALPQTYSFTDITGAFSHPLIGQITFGGEIGTGKITISMETDHTEHKVAADGGVMVSYKPGETGAISIEMLQSSPLFDAFQNWYNAVLASIKLGTPGVFASATCQVRSLLTGRSHTAIGISIGKQAEQSYGETGESFTWTLPCAKIVNE